MIKDGVNIKEVPFVFRTTFGSPLDVRSVINSYETASTELPQYTRYHGMLVFCKSNNKLYVANELLNLVEVLDPENLPRGVKNFANKQEVNLRGLVDGDLVYIESENKHYFVKDGVIEPIQVESLIKTFANDDDVQHIFSQSKKPEIIVNPATGKLLVLSKNGYIEVSGGSKDIYTFERYEEILDSQNVRYREVGKLYFAKDRNKYYTFHNNIQDTSLKPITTEVFGGGGTGPGGGGTHPPVSGPQARVTSKLSVSRAKLGQSVLLTYGFLHTTDGEQDGTLGFAKLRIDRGTVNIAEIELGLMNSGDQITIPVDNYIKEIGNFIMQVVVEYDEEGEQKQKIAKSSLTTFDISISLYNKSTIESIIASGGYKTDSNTTVTLSVSGGATDLIMYVDGVQHETKQLSRTGGTQSFNIPVTTLSPGTHSLQFVATIGDLVSNSVYIDILKYGASVPFVGLLFSRKDGKIIESGSTTEIIANQYEGSTFEYIASLPTNHALADITITNGQNEQQLRVPKLYQTYSTRFTKKGEVPFVIKLNQIQKQFNINVKASTIEGIGIKDGAIVELIAIGKNNEEETKNVWSYGTTATTTFENVDFSSSGWFDGILRLLNGAKATINYQPFKQDAKRTGLTISFEAKIYNVRRFSKSVISCFDDDGLSKGNFGGFKLTPNRITVPIGATQEFVTEDGERIVRDLGLDLPTTFGEFYSITLVIHPASVEKTIRLYINGVLSKADTYQSTFFVQQNPQGIVFDSQYADIDLKYLRIYDTALSDDEILNNYITDRPTIEEMIQLRDKNDVLDENGDISWDKLRRKNKAVLSIAMNGGLETLWGVSTDTKTNHNFKELIFRSPYGREYDLKVTDGVLRRQGTSTSTYPIKNIRIYLTRNDSTKVYRNISKTRNDEWELVESREYTMRPGGKPMKIINLKTDYADSSLCYNTGTSILLNDLLRSDQDLLTPGMRNDDKARFGIDGMPIDVFTMDTPEGYPRYCGQFQFNNDKSKSGYLFGQTKKDGTELALEFINNSDAVGNFAITGDVAEQLSRKNAEGFDASVEFLFPEKDWLWNGKTSETTAPENAKNAIIRLWSWVKSCVPEGVDPSRMSTEQVKVAFKSGKFKREVSQYFNVMNLCMWYVITDYHMSVDQRVKNTFFRTWGDGIWWLTYYDGDTAFGKRNDAFLAYDYNINRDTIDLQRNKYAFEGHNSRLWCLVIANLETELYAAAKKMRERLTNAVYLRVFNQEIMDNWSQRQYNKSGIYKYIKPTYTNWNGNGTMNYIFALNGDMFALRNQLIQRRFSLLDAKYLVGEYEKDTITGYIGKDLGIDAEISITAADEYYFGWKKQNDSVVSQYQQKQEGEIAIFRFDRSAKFALNDPLRFLGASRVRKIDFGTASRYLQGVWGFNNCKLLEEIIAQVTGEGSQPTQWVMNIETNTILKKIDLTGQQNVIGSGSSDSVVFDTTNQTSLQELKLKGTRVTSINIAPGSPLTRLELPATLTKLKLISLPKLSPENLIMENDSWSNIRTVIFNDCAQLNWVALLQKCTNVERVRITGVDIEDDGTILDRFMNVRGVDASEHENEVPTCELVGTCTFTRYIEDDKFAQYERHFPSLTLKQKSYTILEIDDNVLQHQNISNLDNKTGYKFSNEFVPNGHLLKIVKGIHRVLGKQEELGIMKVIQLHDQNSLKYDNGLPEYNTAKDAIVNGDQGDIYVYYPEFHYKGINDVLSMKKYAVYTIQKNPETPEGRKITGSELRSMETGRVQTYANGARLGDCVKPMTNSTDYYQRCYPVVAKIPCEGWKWAYTPMSDAFLGNALIFFNENDEKIKAVSISPESDYFQQCTNVVVPIPEGAKYFVTCYSSAHAPEAYVWLTNSDNPADWEPDWVYSKEFLVAALPLINKNGKLMSAFDPAINNLNRNNTLLQDRESVESRGGLTITTYDHIKNIINLFIFFKGHRAPFKGKYSSPHHWGNLHEDFLKCGMNEVEKSSYNNHTGYVNRNGIREEVKWSQNLLGLCNPNNSIRQNLGRCYCAVKNATENTQVIKFGVGNSFPFGIVCNVTNTQRWGSYYHHYKNFQYVTFGKYMDLLPTLRTSRDFPYHLGQGSFIEGDLNSDYRSCLVWFRFDSWGSNEGRVVLDSYGNGEDSTRQEWSGVRLLFDKTIRFIETPEEYERIPNNF